MTTETLSLVVPVYNEERRVASLLRCFEADDVIERQFRNIGLELSEIIIVNDGSTDSTVEVIAQHGTRLSNLVTINSGDGNCGKGAAVAAGVKRASGALTLVSDVDLSTPLSDVEKLFRAITDGADVAIGSRGLREATVLNTPRYRVLIGRVFNKLQSVVTGLKYADTQCGFKLFRTALAKDLLSPQIVSGFAYDVEVLMRAYLAGATVVEVPVTYIHDHNSKVSVVRSSLSMARDILRLSLALRLRSSQKMESPVNAAN